MKKIILSLILSLLWFSGIKSQVHTNIYYKYPKSDTATIKEQKTIPKYHPIFLYRIEEGKITKKEIPFKVLVLETFNRKINLYDYENEYYFLNSPTITFNVSTDETHPLNLPFIKTDYFSKDNKIKKWNISYKLTENGNFIFIKFEKDIWLDSERFWLGIEKTEAWIKENRLKKQEKK